MKTAEQSINGTATKKYWLTEAECRQIANDLTGQARLIFLIIINTGKRFTKTKARVWGDYNNLRSTLSYDGVLKRLPKAVNRALGESREESISEDDYIFKMAYRGFWDKITRRLYKFNIPHGYGVTKMLRMTFARKHFEIFRSKKRLMQDIGVSTLRHYPKAVFKISGPPLGNCLFEEVA